MDEITEKSYKLAKELLEKAQIKSGQILLVGCSTSEVGGYNPGTHSVPETGMLIATGILKAAQERGVFLAAQCCEHLNRALIIEAEAAEKYLLEQVNAVPQPKAGGSFATAVYSLLKNPVAVEGARAHAGLDIGGVLIGMNLRPVAVPLRLSEKNLGSAMLIAARTRPKYVGGERTVYDDDLR